MLMYVQHNASMCCHLREMTKASYIVFIKNNNIKNLGASPLPTLPGALPLLFFLLSSKDPLFGLCKLFPEPISSTF